MTDQTNDRPTMTDVVNTLTGFDEIAIAKAFGRDFAVLLNHPTTLGRALIFVLNRREEMNDPTAYKAAMEMPLGVVNDYFADESDDDEDPETAAGEDDS